MNRGDGRAAPGPLFESYSREGSGFLSYHLRAMGTDNCFLLLAEETPEVRTALQGAFDLFQRLERKLSKFFPDSEVSLVNYLAASRPVCVGSDFLAILDLARQAWELTGGAFDPTVGPLLSAWGFVEMEGRQPGPEEIEALLEVRGMDHVEVDPESSSVRFDRPGISLDLGGIAKGYAVDLAVNHLRECGIPAGAVISGRSTVATWGTPPGSDRWRVNAVNPLRPDASLCTLLAEPGTVSSSGSYERSLRVGGKDVGHVIDPRSGYPVRTVEGVTVWTPSAVLGDVLSTTLFVLGEQGLADTDALGRLVDLSVRAGEPLRCSVVLVHADASAADGVRLVEHAVGPPALVRAD